MAPSPLLFATWAGLTPQAVRALPGTDDQHDSLLSSVQTLPELEDHTPPACLSQLWDQRANHPPASAFG